MCITFEKHRNSIKPKIFTKTIYPMKTKNIFTLSVLILLVAVFALTGCKKDKTTEPVSSTASMQQLAKDEVTVTKASDETLNDANTVLSGGQGNFKSTEFLWPCHATIDSVIVGTDSITYRIVYNGINCPGNRTRVGVVEVTRKISQPWGEPGAGTVVRFINLRITKNSNNKSLVLNGTKVFVNVSGGYMWQLGNTMTSIVHHAYGSLNATFDDGTTRQWQFDRQRTFTGVLGALVLTIDGLGSADGYSNLEIWGVNRNGENFYSQITHSVVHKTACDWDPVTGVQVHQIPADNKMATITYGYDDNFQLVTNGDCPTYFRVDWQKGANSGTFYVPLP
jgi:hypothetical protein